MINVDRDANSVYIYDDGKLLKICNIKKELKCKSDIDEVVDECIFPYCVQSRYDLVMEHHAKRLYLKIKLSKLLGYNNEKGN